MPDSQEYAQQSHLREEVAAIACYLINKSLISTLVDNTLMEVWMGKNPSLQHLHVFGYEAYNHVLEEKRSKMDNKEMKCIFNWIQSWCKRVQGLGLYGQEFLYKRNVIFREVKSSLMVVQLEEDEKKLVL